MLNALVSVEMSLGCQATVQTSDRWGAQGYVVGLDGKPAGAPAQLCESRLILTLLCSVAVQPLGRAAPPYLLASVRRQPRRVHVREHHRGVLLAVRKIVIPSRSHSLNFVAPFVLLRVALTVITIAEVQGQHEGLPDAP